VLHRTELQDYSLFRPAAETKRRRGKATIITIILP
jgi:hypothetical protein